MTAATHKPAGRASNTDAHAGTLVLLASTALLAGVSVYLFERPSEHIYFVPDWLAAMSQPLYFLGSVANHLPTFFHPFAFSLLTIAVIGISRNKAVIACFFWWLVDSAFEIAQHIRISTNISGYIPDWFVDIPFLEATHGYLLQGTFDHLDLISIFLGAATAFACTFFLLTRLETRHEQDQ